MKYAHQRCAHCFLIVSPLRHPLQWRLCQKHYGLFKFIFASLCLEAIWTHGMEKSHYREDTRNILLLWKVYYMELKRNRCSQNTAGDCSFLLDFKASVHVIAVSLKYPLTLPQIRSPSIHKEEIQPLNAALFLYIYQI